MAVHSPIAVFVLAVSHFNISISLSVSICVSLQIDSIIDKSTRRVSIRFPLRIVLLNISCNLYLICVFHPRFSGVILLIPLLPQFVVMQTDTGCSEEPASTKLSFRLNLNPLRSNAALLLLRS